MEPELDRFLVLCVSKLDMIEGAEGAGPRAEKDGAMLDARRGSDERTYGGVEDEGLGDVWRIAGMTGKPGFTDLEFDGRETEDC
jgi:hypothetical protein